MKKLILAFAFVFGAGTCSMSFASSAPKHRYQPSTTVVADQKNTVAQDTVKVAEPPTQDEGVEAYSDTTATEAGVDDGVSQEEERDSRSLYSPLGYDSPFDYFGTIFGKAGLVVLIIFCVIIGLLLAFAPFIIILLLIRYLMRRHDDKVKLAEMAMQQGHSIPEEKKSIELQSNEYLVRRGLRNTFLGLGIAVMSNIWDNDFFTGIGFFIIFYGLGQAVIGFLPTLKEIYQRWKDHDTIG